jgi:exopolysaccharide biosynthesis polyprenyl glycosylphosphotransferase
MNIVNRRESWFLFVGDLAVFTFSLWLSLSLRYFDQPTVEVFLYHLTPFSILFAIWVLVFFIAGLYDKQTNLFRNRLPSRLLNSQILNSLLAVTFFYFIPYFGITPKTILFVYLAVSLGLIFLWRLYGQGTLTVGPREKALVVGRGEELQALVQEVNSNSRYDFEFISVVDLNHAEQTDVADVMLDRIKAENISIVVIDLQNSGLEKNLSHFYNLLFSQTRFIDFGRLYEEIFDRAPISLLNYSWFLENISSVSSFAYDILKRVADIFFSLFLGLISLLLYPFVILAIKLEDSGPIFIVQERVGQNNKLIKIVKFRSMSFNDNEDVRISSKNKITRVGSFLRRARLDEIPQLWNVLRGDLSLIGPRPELPNLVSVYEKEIPYYNARHLIKPGLSGWAQIYHEAHPHQGSNIVETKNKLSYDLFYIKNRSIILDIQVGLKTIKTLMSRVGR